MTARVRATSNGNAPASRLNRIPTRPKLGPVIDVRLREVGRPARSRARREDGRAAQPRSVEDVVNDVLGDAAGPADRARPARERAARTLAEAVVQRSASRRRRPRSAARPPSTWGNRAAPRHRGCQRSACARRPWRRARSSSPPRVEVWDPLALLGIRKVRLRLPPQGDAEQLQIEQHEPAAPEHRLPLVLDHQGFVVLPVLVSPAFRPRRLGA